MESILLFCVYFSVACWYATEKGWMDSNHIPTHVPTSAPTPAPTIAIEDPSEGLVALADSQSVESESPIGVESTLEPVTATGEIGQSDIEEWLANETWKTGIPIEGIADSFNTFIEPAHLPIQVAEMVGKIPAGVGFQKTARSRQKSTN